MTTRRHSWLAAAGPDGPLTLRPPTPADGLSIHALIAQCPPLDLNSTYAYLLQGLHYANTCVLAEDEQGHLAAYISGYIPPAQSSTLFIWQVAVAPHARGQGLASRLLLHLLDRPHCRGVHWLNTTVGPSNTPSDRLFRHLARELECNCETQELFASADLDPTGEHEPEALYRLGPFDLATRTRLKTQNNNAAAQASQAPQTPEQETPHASHHL